MIIHLTKFLIGHLLNSLFHPSANNIEKGMGKGLIDTSLPYFFFLYCINYDSFGKGAASTIFFTHLLWCRKVCPGVSAHTGDHIFSGAVYNAG